MKIGEQIEKRDLEKRLSCLHYVASISTETARKELQPEIDKLGNLYETRYGYAFRPKVESFDMGVRR